MEAKRRRFDNTGKKQMEARRFDDTEKKQMEAKRRRLDDFSKKQMEAKRREEEDDTDYFSCRIKEMEEDKKYGRYTKEMPPSNIVKYRVFLEKLWGWDRLLAKAHFVSWSDYSPYLEEYNRRNIEAVGSIAALSETCISKEKELMSEWTYRMTSGKQLILPMRKSIILSCLIHKRAHSLCSFSDVSKAALFCIAKEADLTRELLRCGADPSDDYLVDQGIEIRMCALSLMNCTSENSVAASAAMLGMAKEAEMMCAWLSENKPVSFSDDLEPDEFVESRMVRYRTLNLMINILEECSAASAAAAGLKIDKEEPANSNGPGGDGDGVAADAAANTTGGVISDVLNSEYKRKIKRGEKSKRKEEDLRVKLSGLERLLIVHDFLGSVGLPDQCSYVEEYFIRNAYEFVAVADSHQNHEDSQIATAADTGAAVAKFCLKMEEDLLSKWKTRVQRSVHDTLHVSTIIQSSLIKELALSICGMGSELSIPSAIATVCITMEADLMCELLKHGAKPSDDIVQQSIVIRMCALGLVNLKGHESIPAAAAAMVCMASEAIRMCHWMKRENKLLTFSLSEPCDLKECWFIRIRALDVITSLLYDSTFLLPRCGMTAMSI